MPCNLGLLLQVFAQNIRDEEVVSSALIGKEACWLGSDRPVKMIGGRRLESVWVLVIGRLEARRPLCVWVYSRCLVPLARNRC